MPKTVPFDTLSVGPDGYLQNPHQSSVLRFRNGAVERVWRARLAVPLFWTTPFARDELTAAVSTIDLGRATERLEARRAAWKRKTSPHLFRGYPVFVDWVKAFGDGEVQLDLTELEAWRVTPFLDAVARMIDFLDDRASEPGPLLNQEDAAVGFRRRKGAYRLEALAGNLHWPDEVPLFAHGAVELEATTMGTPPFGAGPWPERGFHDHATNQEIKDRSALASRALGASRIAETKLGVIGNLEGIERMRSSWRETCRDFIATASALQQSAPAFAQKYGVFDDSSLWAEKIEAVREWEKRMEAHLDQNAIDVRRAMERI